MRSFGFRPGPKCLAEALSSWNAVLQSLCSKEIKDRISNESGDFLASLRRVGGEAGRVLHYCCICPSSAAQHTCEPSALWALHHKKIANVYLVTGCQQARTRSSAGTLLISHHLYCLLGYGSEYCIDRGQGTGRWYRVYIICPTPADPTATVMI